MSTNLVTLGKLPKKNLSAKPGRTVGLIVVVAVLSFVFFGGSLAALSMKAGLSSVKARMGADIMVVPKGTEKEAAGIFTKGNPGTFYFKKDPTPSVKKVAGVKNVTTQTYISSLKAPCCATQLQIIGFDPKTDFVIAPWIRSQYSDKLQDGQVIAGANIVPAENGNIKLFNHQFPVAAHLAPTGTSFDNSVFINPNTTKMVISYSKAVGRPAVAGVDKAVSNVLVEVEKGYQAEDVAAYINAMGDMREVGAVTPAGLTSKMKATLGSTTNYMFGFLGLFWVTGIIVLVAVFAATANERKRELATLRILGARKAELVKLLMTEAAMLGASGGAVGVFLGALIMYPFAGLIQSNMQLPYLPTGWATGICLALACLIFSTLTAVIAAALATRKVLSKETYLTFRAGE